MLIGLTNIAKMGLEPKLLYTASLTVSFEITYHKIIHYIPSSDTPISDKHHPQIRLYKVVIYEL